MPAPKLTFKKNRLDFTLEGVEFTAGPEIVKIARFEGSLDVNDLLHAKLPDLAKGEGTGVWITSSGDKKIHAIKILRNASGMGLKEAKEVIEGTPIYVPGSEFRRGEEGMREVVDELTAIGGEVRMETTNIGGPSILDVLRDMLTEALSRPAQVSDD